MQWNADTLAVDAGGRLLRRGPRPIAGAFIDSRAALPGGLFVPIVAARDGHDFAPAAIEAGAAAVLVARGRTPPEGDVTIVEVDDTQAALSRMAARRRDGFHGPVVAITGSNGKTTTRAMTAAVLRTGFSQVLCTRGNLNNHLGVPLTLLGEPHAPDAMVIELGMNAPGENDQLAAIVRPTIHVITSVALEHLEFMGSIEAIAAAEAEPIRHLPDGGVVVVPDDEPLLVQHLPAAGVVRFGASAASDVRIIAVEPGPVTRARLRVSEHEVTVALRLFGAHNARNAAAALAVGRCLGLPLPPMVAALERVEPVGDRGRTLALGDHLVIADCYNANPGSVDAALRSLAALRASRTGPLLAVLGDMLELGPRQRELHAAVGRLAADLELDGLATLGPLSKATSEAASGVPAAHFDADVGAAAHWLRARLRNAQPGAVLVKGSRGMALERVVDALVQDKPGVTEKKSPPK